MKADLSGLLFLFKCSSPAVLTRMTPLAAGSGESEREGTLRGQCTPPAFDTS